MTNKKENDVILYIISDKDLQDWNDRQYYFSSYEKAEKEYKKIEKYYEEQFEDLLGDKENYIKSDNYFCIFDYSELELYEIRRNDLDQVINL